MLFFSPVVVRVLPLERQLAPILTGSVSERLRNLHAPLKTLRRTAQLELGIDVELARDVDRGEEDIAELVARRLFFQLAQLVLEIRHGAGEVGVLEADRLRALLDLPREEERRKPFGDVVEDPLPALLLDLDPLPVRANPVGRLGLDVAENVRVPAHELRVHAARDPSEVAGTSFGEQQREEVDLEEQVAELVEQLRVVGRERGVGDLVRLLDGVRNDRLRRLLAIPWALAAQPLRQRLKL